MSKITSIKSEISNTWSQVTVTVTILLEEAKADYLLRVTPNGCTIDRFYDKEDE